MKYFTIEELSKSAAAKHGGIDNTPPAEVVANMIILIEECLDPIRSLWRHPIAVNSGYRCAQLNRLVGGSKTSDHVKGCACDITTRSKADNVRLFDMIQASKIQFDQLILENGGEWIHVGHRKGKNRMMVLTR